MNISLFFRKKRINANSIEEVFGIIRQNLRNVTTYEMPYTGGSPIVVLRNISYASRLRSSVNHITGDVHYIALGLGRHTVLTVHDVGSGLQGGVFKRLYIKLFWFWMPALCVKRITVISEFTKRELSAIVPFAKSKIRVIPNPFNPQIAYEPKSFNKTCPRILHLGTKENKNLARIIPALKDIPCLLVIIGRLTENQSDLLRNNGILYENYYDVSYSEIVSQYKACDLVSFATTYEGFGVPVLEANAAGRPIVAGNVTAVPEVAGESACLVDPYDGESIRRGFLKVIQDDNYRAVLVRNGFENIKRFSPDRIAGLYLDIYKEVCK